MSDSLLPDPQPAHLFERCVRSETVFQGNFLHVRRDTVALPDGRQSSREYVVHPGAVMIVPVLDDGRLLLERQFRYPLQRAMIEFPAGKLDQGEHSFACARRELREETGYSAREWARAGVLHPVISYATEFIDIWFARGLTAGPRSLDEGEFLDVLACSPAELGQACRDGIVTDAKTLTAMLWVQNVLCGDWSLDWRAEGDWLAGCAQEAGKR
ncbi:MAG TPA: NUDIX hydrolase [Macromonas sp.]|nr:NUDIX hydrolase [Macromonas sp.]